MGEVYVNDRYLGETVGRVEVTPQPPPTPPISVAGRVVQAMRALGVSGEVKYQGADLLVLVPPGVCLKRLRKAVAEALHGTSVRSVLQATAEPARAAGGWWQTK